MKTQQANIWDIYAEVKVIPTNGMVHELPMKPPVYTAVMGAGLALQAKQRIPSLPIMLGGRIHKYGNILHIFQIAPAWRGAVNCSVLVAFPTKLHYRYDSDMGLIENRARDLKKAADQNNWSNILLPRLGCGLGNLSWEHVESVLSKYFDERFTVVTPHEAS